MTRYKTLDERMVAKITRQQERKYATERREALSARLAAG